MSQTERTFSIKTLGCKLNQYESSLIAHKLGEMGWVVKPFGQVVDVVIVNTCTVTDKSDKKCRNYIRQASRLARIGGAVVTGCLAERDRKGLEAMEEVSAVVGNDEKEDLHMHLSLLAGIVESAKPVNFTHAAGIRYKNDIDREPSPEEYPLPLFHTRGFLKIQDGCDGQCTYCIVPTVRGKARSRNIREVLEHAQMLIEKGCPELVLSGITIGRYLSEGRDLVGLVQELAALPGRFRVRITSIEPDHITDGLIALLGSEKVCRHIHIPAQSGSDRILSAMRRPYDSGRLRALIDSIKGHDDAISIGSDIIVGFPGETENDFGATLDLVKYAGFSYVHQFTFSPRKGTPAAEMENRCSETEIASRSKNLRQLVRDSSYQYRKRFEGKILPCVIEKNMRNANLTAVSDNYMKLQIDGAPAGSCTFCGIAGVLVSSVTHEKNSGTIVS